MESYHANDRSFYRLGEDEHSITMRILLISFACRKTDGRLNELIKVCNMIAETVVISRAAVKEENTGENYFPYQSHRHFDYIRFIHFCIKAAKTAGKADVIFADNRAAIIPAMLCKMRSGARYTVYDARELYISKEVRHLRGKLGCLVEKIWIRRFDVITSANSFRAELMKKLHKLKKTPIVFENIRRLEPDNSDENEDGFMSGRPTDKKTINIISTSGCLLERKCDVLASAVCRLGGRYKLFLVGYADKAGKKAVEEIKKVYQTDRIVCIDWLEKQELKRLMNACDIAIVSYGNDNSNNKYCASGKIYEYLFEGLPVVTTSNPPLKEMCERFEIGIADDGFYTGIETLSANIERYQKNVREYINTVNVDGYNKKLAAEIVRQLRPPKEKKYEKLLFITSGYPTEGKQLYTFLDALVCAMADLGKECTVLYPVSYTHFILHKEKLPPKEWKRRTQSGRSITVLCPRIITFSSGKLLHRVRCFLNYHLFRLAVNRTIRKHKLRFDVAYGHFLYPSGFVAAETGKRYGVASCVAYGENTSYNVDVFGVEKSGKMISGITACISVSSDNTRFLTENHLILNEKIATIPNAINRDIFYPKNKTQMREKYNISQDSFVVAFVGYFTEIKGSQRLSAALDRIDGVHSVFIGSGALKPTCKNIDFMGSVPHDEIADLLSAADIFVLPTLAEGCCNAIIEALSCGLPVISSEMPFNDDILNNACSIRIDTRDISAIADSICLLRDDGALRLKMSQEALRISETLDIKIRAERIIEWIRHCDGFSVFGSADGNSASPFQAASEDD